MEKNTTSASVRETTAQESCMKYFDAVWFCFTPGHQIRHYYVAGDLDTCQETLSDMYRCFAGKTRLFKGDRPRGHVQTIWQHRTAEEAEQFWHNDFKNVFSASDDDRSNS